MEKGLERRWFLRIAALFGAGAVAGCGGEDVAALRARARELGADLDCSNVSDLQDAEVQTRTENEFRQHSERDDQFCMNCLNWIPPASGTGCGTCKTVRGPINPDGWCKQWTQARG